MTKHALDVPFTVVSVDRQSPTPFNVQLFMGLRAAIRSGRLSAGVRLPSTRKMAAELGLSRNTVLDVFEQLHAEGYVEARSRSGSYVAHVLPDDSLIAPRGAAPVSPMESRTPTVSRRGSLFAAMTMHPPARPPPRAFQPGLAAVDLAYAERQAALVAAVHETLAASSTSVPRPRECMWLAGCGPTHMRGNVSGKGSSQGEQVLPFSG